jgi:surface carbohydrate biosynthesis protein
MKIVFSLPKKTQILIYDVAGSEILIPYLRNYRVSVLKTRREEINIPIFIVAVLRNYGKKSGLWNQYIQSYIRSTKPNVLLTLIDNNLPFLKLASQGKYVKIFVQNGNRSLYGDVFDDMQMNQNLSVDFMFVHNRAIGNEYSKYVSGQVIVTGSFRNNSHQKSYFQATKDIIFLSQYSDFEISSQIFFTTSGGRQVSYGDFFSIEPRVLKLLADFCDLKALKLTICGRTVGTNKKEHAYYANLLKGRNWEYIAKTSDANTYKLIDSSLLNVFIDSTLGYESISRGSKTISYSCRSTSDYQILNKFGWPLEIPRDGPFWLSSFDETRGMDILNTITEMPHSEWQKMIFNFRDSLMHWDKGNEQFSSLLRDLLDGK